ncbi:LPS assembly protein LptD [Psychrobacter sp. APC 3281]|uniref:LPS-assembly protein LptD n=1 Tax=Psychrobacter sp. APC 3281 TaxID=3035190 RepID=UPI0025B5CCD6|nr:LPS assembly protein LptD [Psychrobacter sp. APC 3281]MDN3447644.1 LPS assembly protein LptD [Psychrobacter sp. APC 3281]
MPLLYSPLYQSIRLILFGALGLSSLTVSAAIGDANTQKTEPLTTDSTGSYASNSVATDANNISRTQNNDGYQEADILNDSYQDNANSANTNNATLSNDTALDSRFSENNDLDITDINEAADPEAFSNEVSNDTNLNTETSNQPSSDTPDSSAFVPKAITTENGKLDLNDESIQASLMRLAEFYELTPDTDASTLNNDDISTEANNTHNNAMPAAQTIPKVGRDLRLLPNAVDSAQRCEGQWVYPQSNPNYQRAVNEAGTANGQPAPNVASVPNNQAPLFTESDYGYYNNINYAELSGNVKIDQGTQHIEAEKVMIDLSNGVAAAQGKVMFTDNATGQRTSNSSTNNAATNNGQASFNDRATQGGLIGVADSLNYNTETGQSTANDVAFASVGLQAHGYAKRLNKPNESEYELDQVMFSTCPPTNRKWQFEAKSIDLNTDTGRGEAYNTTFRVADIPVFYLPYFNFPIDSRRSSGFLLPSASVSSESGLEVDIPYYFNLAPNYDATLNTHIYTDRNPMLSGEFRYLTESYGEGILNGSYLPNDKEYDDEDRTSLFYDHTWSSKSIPRLSADAEYNYVSDADYLNDFDTLGLSDSTINLPRRARVNYYNDYVDGELKVETFQTLDAFTDSGEALEDKDKPYSRLPQLKLNYRLPWAERFDITGIHDSAYFKKSIDDGSENEKSGARIYNKLSAAYPMETSWGYIKPKLSLQHLYTSYDEDSLEDNQLSEEDGSQSVFVPQASIDAGLHFYQAGSPFGAFDDTMGGYRLLSPRVKYTYSPYKNQNDIPNFNTRIASINYEQLFSDSWFLGHDRLQDLHSITPGVNYRYIDATGVTRFDGSIAEQFYLDDGRVTLDDDQPVFTSSSSGMVWETSTQPYNNFWVDVSGALTSNYDLNYVTTELRYQPSNNSLFNVGYVKRQRDDNTEQLPLSAFTASAIFPINNSWRILAQGQYDLNSDRMLDSLVGVDYEDCCFGFAVYGRRYYNDLNVKDEPTQAIMAEVRLNGLGSGSSRLTRLLADKILGFEPVQTAWKD